MISRMIGRFFPDDLALDLGTCNTLIYTRGEVLVNEPSVVAFKGKSKGGRKLAAAGAEARMMLGKESNGVKAVMPVREGAIVDFEMAALMLRYYLGKTGTRRFGRRRRVLVNAPTAMTQVECKALIDTVESAGAGEVRLIKEPIAAGLGAGLRIGEPEGSMIVDIGGGITEAAVLSLSEIVCSKSIAVAGNHMDAGIVQYIRRKYSLLIGEKSGEDIKTSIGAFSEGEGLVLVKGRDLISGLPNSREIDAAELRNAIMPMLDLIADAIKDVLGQSPPELSADIVDNGIVLSGGCALIPNLPDILTEKIGVTVMISDNPLLTVVRGAGMALGGMRL